MPKHQLPAATPSAHLQAEPGRLTGVAGLRSVCVFCGSNPGRRPEYVAGAAALGAALVGRGIRVVYGGARVGTMGALADAVLAAGGEITGVIPAQLVDAEVAHPGLADLRVVGSMHERKAAMAALADGFIALPGGVGTLEEFAEVVTWSQLGLHAKPTGLLNLLGYYDDLLRFLDHARAERFLRPAHRDIILAAAEPVALLDDMARWRPEPGAAVKWMDADGADLHPGAAHHQLGAEQHPGPDRHPRRRPLT